MEEHRKYSEENYKNGLYKLQYPSKTEHSMYG